MTSGLPSTRVVGRALGLLVILTIFTNLNTARAHEAGLFEPLSEGLDPTFRIVREALVWLLALALANAMFRHKRAVHRPVTISPRVMASLLVLTACVTTTVIRAGELGLLLPGMRVLPLLIILAGLAQYGSRDRLAIAAVVARACALFIVVQAVIAARQIVVGVPAMFGATAVGPRPYGTLATPNLLGIAALGCLIIFLLTRPNRARLLVTLCLVLCLISGSRTAVLGAVLALLGVRAGSIRYRWLLVPNAIAVTYGLYLAASSRAVSGRVIESEGRFEAWRAAADAVMLSPADWLFGAGVGVGTNAARTLVSDTRTGQALPVADSAVVTILLSFGFLGLAVAALAFARFVRATDSRGWIVTPAILLVALTLNLPEVAPFNFLMVVAAALILPDHHCPKLPDPRPSIRSSRHQVNRPNRV